MGSEVSSVVTIEKALVSMDLCEDGAELMPLPFPDDPPESEEWVDVDPLGIFCATTSSASPDSSRDAPAAGPSPKPNARSSSLRAYDAIDLAAMQSAKRACMGGVSGATCPDAGVRFSGGIRGRQKKVVSVASLVGETRDRVVQAWCRAVRNKREDVMFEMSLQYPWVANSCDDAGKNALSFAIESHSFQLVSPLVRMGVELRFADSGAHPLVSCMFSKNTPECQRTAEAVEAHAAELRVARVGADRQVDWTRWFESSARAVHPLEDMFSRWNGGSNRCAGAIQAVVRMCGLETCMRALQWMMARNESGLGDCGAIMCVDEAACVRMYRMACRDSKYELASRMMLRAEFRAYMARAQDPSVWEDCVDSMDMRIVCDMILLFDPSPRTVGGMFERAGAIGWTFFQHALCCKDVMRNVASACCATMSRRGRRVSLDTALQHCARSEACYTSVVGPNTAGSLVSFSLLLSPGLLNPR
jgi:hypothetical protein